MLKETGCMCFFGPDKSFCQCTKESDGNGDNKEEKKTVSCC